MTSPTRKLGRWFAAGAALLTLTGCIRADIGIQLNDDESGTFRVKMLVNREKMLELTGMFGEEAAEDPCTSLVDDPGDVPDNATVTPVEDGDWCGVDMSMPFSNLDELSELTAEFNDESESSEDPSPYGQVVVTKVDGGYRFEVGDVAMSDDSMGFGDDGLDGEGMGEFAEMMEQLLGDMRVTYVVRLPGRPVDHNADSVDGNTFTFDLKFPDARTELYAQTGPGQPDASTNSGGSGAGSDDGGNSTLWIVLAVVGVAAVAAIAYFVIRSRRSGGPGTPSAAAPAAPPAPPAAPPAPPAAPPAPPAPGATDGPGWQPPQG